MKHLSVSFWFCRWLPLLGLLCLLAPVAQAQTPITKGIRMIVPYCPGEATDALQAKLKQQGYVTVGGSSNDFATWISSEITKWAKIIKDANIKAE
ncbi:MAG: hypothetical protein WCG12_02295 [Alcaligenaceae bacterium]